MSKTGERRMRRTGEDALLRLIFMRRGIRASTTIPATSGSDDTQPLRVTAVVQRGRDIHCNLDILIRRSCASLCEGELEIKTRQM
jgi:hypothetical protein